MGLLRSFRRWMSRFILCHQIPVLRPLNIPDLVAIVKQGDTTCRSAVLSSTGDLVHYVFGIGYILQQVAMYPCLHTIYWMAAPPLKYIPYELYATTLPKLSIDRAHPVYRHINIFIRARRSSRQSPDNIVWLYIPWNSCLLNAPRVFTV